MKNEKIVPNYAKIFFVVMKSSNLKTLEMTMAILLVYSSSGIISGKKVCHDLKTAAVLKILKYSIQL